MSTPDRYDRRAVRISLTPEGERVRSDIATLSSALDEALVKDERLADLLETLARAVVVVDDHLRPRFVRKRIR